MCLAETTLTFEPDRSLMRAWRESTKRLTEATVQKPPLPEHGQKLYVDNSLPGFEGRVSQGGSKSFVLSVGAGRRLAGAGEGAGAHAAGAASTRDRR